jgi:hypothetical protein
MTDGRWHYTVCCVQIGSGSERRAQYAFKFQLDKQRMPASTRIPHQFAYAWCVDWVWSLVLYIHVCVVLSINYTTTYTYQIRRQLKPTRILLPLIFFQNFYCDQRNNYSSVRIAFTVCFLEEVAGYTAEKIRF